MSKTVKIDYDLYRAIYDYFCGTGADENFIRSSLEQKEEKMLKRTMYSISKNKDLSDEVREYARQNYLDLKGVPEEFRW